jgi:cbb3-type cytochrome oxidase subunit 3
MVGRPTPSPDRSGRFLSYAVGLFLVGIIAVIYGAVLRAAANELLGNIVLFGGFFLCVVSGIFMKLSVAHARRDQEQAK